MSLGSRLALVDDRSTASNPGGVSVQPLRFTAHFPFWPLCFIFFFLASAAWSVLRPSFWPVPAGALILNLLYWVRVRLRFRFGCVNPSQVVSTSPFLLAVFTDLTTGDGEYPVIKILSHPIPRGTRYSVGDKCATVAMYSGSTEAEHWEDFDPIMIDCATRMPSVKGVLRSIPNEEWSNLEEGLKSLPMPLKTGLYPLPALRRADSKSS
jgi:hypothetical protein